jgi:DNA modification methylase
MTNLKGLLENANSQAPVTGLTHEFYKYPARFSPQFARSAIAEFTRPMETVMDPFMGGGTSAVEALGLGRRFIGSDLNSLSIFVTRTKTTPLSVRSEKELVL